jgi:threonine/homoserine/homoserine lactone efflux protein
MLRVSVGLLLTTLVVVVSPGTGVLMLVTFVVFVGYGLAAAWVRRHVISRPRVLVWMCRTIASAFVGLGAKLAFAER